MLGLHVLMEFHDCSFEKLNNMNLLEQLMNNAANLANATIIKSVFHQFSPQGVTGVVVVAESHLAIHTWPERGYAAVDFFTCNTGMAYKEAYTYLSQQLESKQHYYKSVDRGVLKAVVE